MHAKQKLKYYADGMVKRRRKAESRSNDEARFRPNYRHTLGSAVSLLGLVGGFYAALRAFCHVTRDGGLLIPDPDSAVELSGLYHEVNHWLFAETRRAVLIGGSVSGWNVRHLGEDAPVYIACSRLNRALRTAVRPDDDVNSHEKPPNWERYRAGDIVSSAAVTEIERVCRIVELYGGGEGGVPSTASRPQRESGAMLTPRLPSVSDPREQAVFRCDGRGWEITYGGRTRHVGPSKGLGYIQQLLAVPGRPIPSWTLAGMSPGSIGVSILDSRAIQELRSRSIELEGELEAARCKGNTGDEDQIRREMRQIANELLRGAAMSGHGRRMGDERNTTRQRVGRAISRAIHALSDECPELHRHLLVSIRNPTSANPCYAPREQVEWTLV